MQVSRPWCPWPHVAARTCHSCSTLCCRHIQIGTGGALCVRAGLCAQLHGATAGLCAQLHGATAARCHKHQHGAMSIGCTVPQASAARCHEHQLHGATSISTAPRASAARCHKHQHGATSISCTVPRASAARCHKHQLHGATSISTAPRASAARRHKHQLHGATSISCTVPRASARMWASGLVHANAHACRSALVGQNGALLRLHLLPASLAASLCFGPQLTRLLHYACTTCLSH